MKFSVFPTAAVALSAAALTIGKRDAKTYTIELAPGEIRTVTEAERWALKLEGKHFMDITNYPDLGTRALKPRAAAVVYPSSVSRQAAITPLRPSLSKSNMQSNLQTFSNYYNRHYRSSYGAQSSQWLQSLVQAIVTASGADKYGATVKAFKHSWGQSSIIASIPGKSAKTIVIGAH